MFYGVRATVPLLRAARGAVVITSSIHAAIGFKGFPAYAAAKGGLGALVRQLAVEYGGEIRFNAVLPGALVTALWAHTPARYKVRTAARTPVGRLGTPEDIAAAVAFLASDDASFITGQSLLVDGGRRSAPTSRTAPERDPSSPASTALFPYVPDPEVLPR